MNILARRLTMPKTVARFPIWRVPVGHTLLLKRNKISAFQRKVQNKVIKDSCTRWSCTIITHQPGSTTQGDIFDQLMSTSKMPATMGTLGFVVLATPSFATWLEDDAFISGLLVSVMPPAFRYTKLTSAVVDKIPPPPGNHNVTPGGEGFSFLCGPKSLVFSDRSLQSRMAGDTNDRASIEFWLRNDRFAAYGQDLPPVPATVPGKDIVVPLARTIFQNGKDYTLSHSTWCFKPKKGGKKPQWEKRDHPGEKTNRLILFPDDATPHVPVIALTEPCKIVSGMGNIVRQIAKNDAEGTIIPASKELETSVSNAYERLGLPSQAVSVWAVISRDPAAVDSVSTECISNESSGGTDYQMLSKFYHSDSSIHRVLSGGGGWGLKEGLISLDPQSELDFFPIVKTDKGEPEREALGDIAKPGSFIQFFLAASASPKNVMQNLNARIAPVSDQNLRRRSLVLGTTPSSIDHMPDASADASEASKEATFSVYGSHFGALSEQGIFCVQRGTNVRREIKKIRSTKLDIPGSWMQIDTDRYQC